jgi:predicted ATPase
VLHLARTLLCLGHVAEARRRKAEALAEARALSPYTLAYALCQSWDDDWAIDGARSAHAVLRTAEELVAISREQNFPMWLGFGSIMRGWCLGVSGEAAEGIPLILRGLEICRAIGTNLGTPFVLMALAEVYGMAGQPEDGLARLAEAGRGIETTQERWAEAEILRTRGTLLAAMHDRAAAAASYRAALAVARRQGARFWELRAAIDLARLLRDQQRADDARDVLSPVCDWFGEEHDAPAVRDARVLLQ